MEEYKTYNWTGKKGFDDLKDHNPYYGEWGCFRPAFKDVTEDSYKSDKARYVSRVKEWNEKYIQDLKDDNKYGEEYVITFNFKSHPEFDDPKHITDANSKLGIFMPLGNVTKENAPKFNIKYNPDESDK